MRARLPDDDGFVERDGVKVSYEVFGHGEPAIVLMPAWSIVHSRTWKMQVPYLSRHYRVITLDGRGNGRSGRPPGADSYLSAEYAADAVAVMDATGTDRAVVVSFSRGASYALHLGAARPERVLGHVFICPTTPLAPFAAPRLPYVKRFEETLDDEEGWAKDNARYWQRDYRRFLEFFFAQVFTEHIRPGPRRTASPGVWRRHPRRSRIRDAEPSAKRDAAWRHCSPPCSALAWSSREPRTPSPGPRPALS